LGLGEAFSVNHWLLQSLDDRRGGGFWEKTSKYLSVKANLLNGEGSKTIKREKNTQTGMVIEEADDLSKLNE